MTEKSFVFYRGPSMLDGAPIVAIATITKSRNSKTGTMVQTWILRSDLNPMDASKVGADRSICGDCTHRGQYDAAGILIPSTRTCYVTLFHAPRSVHAAFSRGIYDDMTGDIDGAAERIRGRMVRLGAYGDPAAVPFGIWDSLLTHADGLTGYTHQWQAFPEFAAYVMASCDSSADRVHARMLGFRTFRVAAVDGWNKESGEILCPASAEAGKKTTCIACQACGGHSAKARADVMIPAHGQGKNIVAGA